MAILQLGLENGIWLTVMCTQLEEAIVAILLIHGFLGSLPFFFTLVISTSVWTIGH